MKNGETGAKMKKPHGKCGWPYKRHLWSIPDSTGKSVCLFCDKVRFTNERPVVVAKLPSGSAATLLRDTEAGKS